MHLLVHLRVSDGAFRRLCGEDSFVIELVLEISLHDLGTAASWKPAVKIARAGVRRAENGSTNAFSTSA